MYFDYEKLSKTLILQTGKKWNSSINIGSQTRIHSTTQYLKMKRRCIVCKCNERGFVYIQAGKVVVTSPGRLIKAHHESLSLSCDQTGFSWPSPLSFVQFHLLLLQLFLLNYPLLLCPSPHSLQHLLSFSLQFHQYHLHDPQPHHSI